MALSVPRRACQSPWRTSNTRSGSAASRTTRSLTLTSGVQANSVPSSRSSASWSRFAPEPDASQTSVTSSGRARGTGWSGTWTSAWK